MTTLPILVAIAVFVSAVRGTAWLRPRAVGWGLVDRPNARSLHTRAMPRGGGIVIAATVLTGLAVLSISGTAGARSSVAALAAMAAVVAVVGWRDDFRPVSPALRFGVHVAAAAAAVAIWGPFDRLLVPGHGVLTLTWMVAAPLTAAWIVGVLNAYNFMDGIDGIAAATAVVAGLAWTWLGASSTPLPSVAGLLIAAGAAGFLWHNWPPAKIFMGDAGSGFLGFCFAVLPLIAFDSTADARVPAVAVLLLAPFLFDASVTLVRRLSNGENVVQAHRTHFYQRLVLAGWSHRRVAQLYTALALCCVVAGAGWMQGAAPSLLVAPAAALLLLPLLVLRAERTQTVAARTLE